MAERGRETHEMTDSQTDRNKEIGERLYQIYPADNAKLK